MATKKKSAQSIHDRDRIIVRLPDGMRDKLSELAEANGRSMTSEVVAAIEKHLARGSDIEFLEKKLDELWSHVSELSDRVGSPSHLPRSMGDK